MAEGETATTGWLSTHVLDTASGTPAANVEIELFRIDGEARTRIANLRTNDDGRCDGPLLIGDTFTSGQYELLFHVAAYYRAKGVTLPEPAFLDQVPIRFGISDGDAHYHVPLLVAPYGYSTYRGS